MGFFDAHALTHADTHALTQPPPINYADKTDVFFGGADYAHLVGRSCLTSDSHKYFMHTKTNGFLGQIMQTKSMGSLGRLCRQNRWVFRADYADKSDELLGNIMQTKPMSY